MIAWTLITLGLSYGSLTNRNARNGLVLWLVSTLALFAIGVPAYYHD